MEYYRLYYVVMDFLDKILVLAETEQDGIKIQHNTQNDAQFNIH